MKIYEILERTLKNTTNWFVLFNLIGCNDTFGYECMSPCSIKCPDSQCDSMNNHCGSCFPGYYGSTCEGLIFI